MTTVHTPVEGYTGEIAGVAFINGHAETTNKAALSYFKSAGYVIEPEKADEPADPEPETEPEKTEKPRRGRPAKTEETK